MAIMMDTLQQPGTWCRGVLAALPEQAGVVHDTALIETLLADLAAADPCPFTFAALLEDLQYDSRPEVARAARRIQVAWDREQARHGATSFEDKPRALVVDDDPIVGELVATILAPRFDVTITSNGPDALELARTRQPALVVLDVMMPDMNGYEVALALRTEPETMDVRILFCTARSGVESRRLGAELGADGYIVKPFELHRLAAVASAVVGIDPLGA